MKVAFLGCGSWGFSLARLLAKKGYEVMAWTVDQAVIETVEKEGVHPRYHDVEIPENLKISADVDDVLAGADVVIESVTAAGLRPVLEQLKDKLPKDVPFILTSKGIEQSSGMTLSEVVIEVLGDQARRQVGSLSGPSFAQEVVKGIPTSVVAAAYEPAIAKKIADLFASPTFRVYPNSDLRGVSFGGAMKNIVAIACGIADGLEFGHSTIAALMTRGLHEIRKLAIAERCRPETLTGLSGMGDLCLTCSSPMSRNYRFGQLLASGLDVDQAKREIGMVVEGAYTCYAARDLAEKKAIPLPITEMVCHIIDGDVTPRQAVKLLMEREVKEEHL